MENEIWKGNEKKHLSKNFLIKFLNNKLKEDIIKTINNIDDIKNVLDIGCGEGFITIEISKNFPDLKILAIDYEKKYIDYAKNFNKNKNIEYIKKDLFSINKKTDLVILTEVLEHLENPIDALNKLKKLSNKFILITIPNEPFFRLGNLSRLKYVKRLGSTPGHLHTWTKKQISILLKKLNFNFKIKTSTFWNIILIRID